MRPPLVTSNSSGVQAPTRPGVPWSMPYVRFIVRDKQNVVKATLTVLLKNWTNEANLPLDQQAVINANYVATDHVKATTWMNKEVLVSYPGMTITEQPGTLNGTWSDQNGTMLPRYI